ncbi:24571_t:CDS:2, partial [Entrophospora sp. SA101]
VKPTNVLINRKGAVKLCDFGVSGQLNMSCAKTNIGCQSDRTNFYTVQSDVWSLGLSMLELATGKYPYPSPDTSVGISLFAQLNAIIQGPPPTLSEDNFSEECKEFGTFRSRTSETRAAVGITSPIAETTIPKSIHDLFASAAIDNNINVTKLDNIPNI